MSMSWSPRRLLVPAVLLLLMAIGPLLPHLYHWTDLDPLPIVVLGVTGYWLFPACLIGLTLWLGVFSGLPGKVRLWGFLACFLLLGGLALAIGDLKFNGRLRPFIRFRWEPLPAEELARYLEAEPDTKDLPPVDLTVGEDDFPRYRGRLGNGIVESRQVIDMTWAAQKPRERWRHPCGGGFAGFAVAGNGIVTIEQRQDNEAVVCYDRGTGKQRWEYAYPAHFKHPTGNGPRATPAIADGDVYSLGAKGDLVCLNGQDGGLRWRKNVLEDNGASGVAWGMTSSPLVVDDLVVVNAGVDPKQNVGRGLVAYRRKDGERVWGASKYQAAYSSPQLATLAGRQQVLIFDEQGLGSYDARTGQELWRREWPTFQEMNIIQPLVLDGDRVLISSETTNGCALLRIVAEGEKFQVETVWENRHLCSKWANPIRIGKSIYGLSNGSLVCLDVETGKRHWRGKWYSHGQILGVGENLLVQSEWGYLASVPADPERFREVARMDVFKDRIWNTPALAGRRLYLRNDVEMVCVELPVTSGAQER